MDVAGRGPMWHRPATTMAGRGLMPVVCWLPRLPPFRSLVPLTFKNVAVDLKPATTPAMAVQ
jgi:hypothetical protein